MRANFFSGLTGFAAAIAMFGISAAQADVFSSQTFTGETSTLNNLPGVDLSVAPGFGNTAGNCVEDEMSFSRRGFPQQATTCKFGNFSITSTGSAGGTTGKYQDTTYGGNPPPWMQGWRP